jgi:aromatase
MKTSNEISIAAPWGRVFDAAAKVEDWPRLLAHYRFVRVLSGQGERRVVDMAASRDGFPCRWVSDQVLDRKKKTVYYLHIRSRWTKGMQVWWLLKPRGPRHTDILLLHDMPDPAFAPWRWFLQRIVGDGFVHNIAGKTLAGLKKHLEAQ